jgi:hypothetical protein
VAICRGVCSHAPVCAPVTHRSCTRSPTPSLPCTSRRNRWQPVATDFACFCGFEGRLIAAGCHQLQPRGSIKAPSTGAPHGQSRGATECQRRYVAPPVSGSSGVMRLRCQRLLSSCGRRASLRSTRSPCMGTPSRSNNRRCSAPFGRLPSARTTRCHWNALRPREDETDEAGRAGIDLGVGANEPGRDRPPRG